MGYPMPALSYAELRMIAEVVSEMAKYRGRSFDASACAVTLGRAAIADRGFRARLAEFHRRIQARRATGMPRNTLAPLFRGLERDAEWILDLEA
jgi:hypothetical protein